ncbi:MAG: VCBS repeat-containing protein, partial [Candidatus Poribacteria bacterium]|nr:VCBS repeat-containing protein [Candidatus Poribacteria bacterium]
DGYRYNPWAQGRIHEVDYNQDGLGDLVFWNEDHFEVYFQDMRGLFASAPITFTTDVLFDSDDLGSLVAPEGVRQRRKDQGASGDMTGRVLYSLTDMNGDGVADLVVFSLKGGSNRFLGQTSELWSMRFTYEVHFGTPTPGRTLFSPDIGAVIHSDGIPFGLEPHDLDHDGQIDVMFTIINPGIFKTIGMLVSALLTRSVSMDLHFYRMEDAIYPDKPNARRKIRTTSLGQSGEKAAAHFPSVLIGDVNGDRHSDLLVQQGRKELRVFLGVPGPDLFSRRPQKVSVTMPNEEYAWLEDLNKDGKQDMLLHYPSTTEPHRVTMLIAR